MARKMSAAQALAEADHVASTVPLRHPFAEQSAAVRRVLVRFARGTIRELRRLGFDVVALPTKARRARRKP